MLWSTVSTIALNSVNARKLQTCYPWLTTFWTLRTKCCLSAVTGIWCWLHLLIFLLLIFYWYFLYKNTLETVMKFLNIAGYRESFLNKGFTKAVLMDAGKNPFVRDAVTILVIYQPGNESTPQYSIVSNNKLICLELILLLH